MQCSELFSKVFDSGCGGGLRICDCGITHFDGFNSWDCGQEGEDEIEDLRQKAKDNPKKFVEHDCSVGTLKIGGASGASIVCGCSCNLARKYEAFIKENARRIAEYLNGRAVILEEEAKDIKVEGKM